MEEAPPIGRQAVAEVVEEVPAPVTPDPDDVLVRLIRDRTPGEAPTFTLLRLYEGAISAAKTEARLIVDEGGNRLKAVGIGKFVGERLVPRVQDISKLDELFNALHNASEVTAGRLRVADELADDYARLRELTDWEESMRLDFDPEMATVQDYFYRGWKVPEGMFDAAGTQVGPRLGTKPSFARPRANATYQQMRDLGFEPLFWNPYEQWRVSRLQGVIHREQTRLVQDLKQIGLAVPHSGGPVPKGWRLPEVGPAFEGKPFAANLADGTQTTMYTKRWIVPEEVAKLLDSIYGKRPDLHSVRVGGKDIDIMNVIDAAVFIPKRAKLFGSLFQQRDFLQRSLGGAWSGMVDALQAGEPVQAVRHLAIWPKSAVDIVLANLGPRARTKIRQQLNSTDSIIEGRPGVHLRGIVKAGLSTIDVTIMPGNIDEVAREVASESGFLGVKRVARAVIEIESAMRRGLFEGVYPAAQITDIRNNIAPMLARQYPSLTDEALNGLIAQVTNKRYSTIPASQSVLQNRAWRETFKRVFFSIGENEGLLRQGTSTFHGPERAFWRKHWIGAYLSLIATANVIHFASTGKMLPKDRYSPISKDRFGPLPFGFNINFASPTLPFVGRGRNELLLDLAGQLDTVFKILDPISFISSRQSVPIRAIQNQFTGKDFFNQPIDEVGPGGFFSRTLQLLSDTLAPIGIGTSALQILRQQVPATQALIPPSEERGGTPLQIIQATGLNVKAASTKRMLEEEAARMFPGEPWDTLTPTQRDKVVSKPDIEKELMLRNEISVARGSDIAIYYAERDKINEDRDVLIAALAERVGPSREFVLALSQHQGDRAVELRALRRLSEKNIKDFSKREVRTSKADIALADYYKALFETQPPLEDPVTFDYDFARREQILKDWRDEHSDVADAVLEFLRRNEHPLVRELREDRDVIADSGYWDITDTLIDSQGIRDLWERYHEEPKSDRPVFLRNLMNKNPEQHMKFIDAQAVIDRFKHAKRTTNCDLDRNLLKWGYVSVPKCKDVIEELRARQLKKLREDGFNPDPVEVMGNGSSTGRALP